MSPAVTLAAAAVLLAVGYGAGRLRPWEAAQEWLWRRLARTENPDGEPLRWRVVTVAAFVVLQPRTILRSALMAVEARRRPEPPAPRRPGWTDHTHGAYDTSGDAGPSHYGERVEVACTDYACPHGYPRALETR